MRKHTLWLVLLALLVACGNQNGTAATPAPVATSAAAPTTAAAAPTALPTIAPTDATAPTTFAEPLPTEQATPPAASTDGQRLVVMTHDSFSVSDEVIQAFEQQSGAKVEFLKSGDAGAALNKAILSKGAPQADVLYGVDNTFLSRALKADIFEPYASPALNSIPQNLKLDPSNQLLPVDFGYVNINYDKAYLEQNKLAVPEKLEDLTKPEWKGKLVVENPATSSPGLAFMLATIAHFGTTGDYTWLNFWSDLRKNDVIVSEGWDDAYNNKFSGSAGKGPAPLVISYATSPAAEVFYSEGKLTEPPTGNIMAGSFTQVEFVGILKGTKQRALAEKFVDFMLGKTFQEDIPLQMFVYPALTGAAQPEVFNKFAQVPEQPIALPADQIDQNRDQWIEAWTKTVLR